MTETRSNDHSLAGLPTARSALLADGALLGVAFTQRYTALIDDWLRGIFAEAFGPAPGTVALVATGGHGRGELAPNSDLDVMLLHDGSLTGEQAQRMWYPIWDAGIKLGQTARTAAEASAIARTDLATATSLLSVRHIAGDHRLTDMVAEDAAKLWRKHGGRWLGQLAAAIEERHAATIDVASALEPDLKEGRGGLRDVHAITWSLATGSVNSSINVEQLRDDYAVLLAARVELHRIVARPGDRLHLQTQDDVAERLGDSDADGLMLRLATAARRIAWASDEHWYDITRQTPSTGLLRRAAKPQDFGHGVRLSDGRVGIAAEAHLDQQLVLRVAIAAATSQARIDPDTLQRLHRAPLLSDPWPSDALHLFVALLATGRSAIAVIEALDQAGLWCRLLPEWEPNRSKPQRNAYHRFTVDHHLLEAVALASERLDTVARPDLLLVGTLLHDIGKGYPGDHTDVGMELAAQITRRLGLNDDDRRVVVALVEHHLLLADTATRRDLDDPATLRWVAAQVESVDELHLLATLTEADSIATGPAAWGPWKAGLVKQLVERVAHVLDDGDTADFAIDADRLEAQRALMREVAASGETLTKVERDELTVVCADRPGLFSRIAGVLAMCGLDVAEASAYGENGMVIDRFRVVSTFESNVPWERVTSTLQQALNGRIALDSRLAERAKSYRRRAIAAHTLQPRGPRAQRGLR